MMEEKYTLISYNPETVDVYASANLDDILGNVQEDRISYVIVRNCTGEDEQAIETLISFFEADPDIAKKILGEPQPMYSDEADTSLFLKYQVPTSDFNILQNIFVERRGSILADEGYLLHFLEDEYVFSKHMHTRLQAGKTQVQNYGADYLLYLLIRTAIDLFDDVINVELQHRFEALEDYIIANPAEDDSLDRLLAEREHVKALYEPLRLLELFLISVREGDLAFISDKTYSLFTQNQMTDSLGLEKGYLRLLDWWSQLLELHRTNVSERTDGVMNLLTIIATIFLPITFLTGVFGMNFVYMPALDSPNGFYILMLSMGVIALVIILYMKRKGWFS